MPPQDETQDTLPVTDRRALPNHVAVRAAARLHLGFLDLNGSLGRRFGSLGLALDRPATTLSIRRATSLSVIGPEQVRASAHLETLCRHLSLKPDYELVLSEAILPHAGLGSGTQLALAVAGALRRLEGLGLDIPGDAELLQRGARSGAGSAIFLHGGLIVDGGHGTRKGVPPVLSRLAFPTSWRILLVIDKGMKGVHGEDERAAFAALPAFETADAGAICRLVLMQALPAIVENDISQFGAAIREIQTILGSYFAPAQGGRYTSAAVGQIMQALEELGAYGMGQSSWGPTGFAFAESETQAQHFANQIAKDAERLHLEIMVCQGANSGAMIEVVS
jgi:beta-RFAP synthase